MLKPKIKNEKGFLGPIGDDLPSLIPLIFALIIFFSSFSFSFNLFDRNSAYFQTSLSVVQISTTFGSGAGSYITNVEKFNDLCKSLNVRRVKYYAFLAKIDTELDIENIDEISQLLGFVCKNTNTVPKHTSKDLMMRLAPVAREVHDGSKFYVEPVLLVVVAWTA